MLNAIKLSKKLLIGLFATVWLAGLYLMPGSLIAAGTNINVSVCPPSPYPAPVITEPSDGTTTDESSVIMTAEATPEVTLYVYRNDVQIGYVTTSSDGISTISVDLDIGTNTLKASTNNGCSTPAFSDPVTVERKAVELPPSPGSGSGGEEVPADSPEVTDDVPSTVIPGTGGAPDKNEPPTDKPASRFIRPVIFEPRSGTKVNDPYILVVGQAAANTPVRILRNDLVMAEVLSDEDGRFTVGITLGHGNNRLVAATGQGSDALYSKTVSVDYEPVPAGITNRWPLMLALLMLLAATAGALTAYLLTHPVMTRQVQQTLRRWRTTWHPR